MAYEQHGAHMKQAQQCQDIQRIHFGSIISRNKEIYWQNTPVARNERVTEVHPHEQQKKKERM